MGFIWDGKHKLVLSTGILSLGKRRFLLASKTQYKIKPHQILQLILKNIVTP